MLFKFPFSKMLYKGKPQNLQYSSSSLIRDTTGASTPTFFPVCQFSLELKKIVKIPMQRKTTHTIKILDKKDMQTKFLDDDEKPSVLC